MGKLGLAVVGVGAMGRRHAENLRRAIPQANLVALADPDQERARRLAAELEVKVCTDSIEPLLARKDIQAIVIASPAKFHAVGAIFDFELGSHAAGSVLVGVSECLWILYLKAQAGEGVEFPLALVIVGYAPEA